MKVIVCGAGQVGFNIARHLADQGNDVTVIDRSPDLIRQISERLDVQALVGFASDPTLLDRAGASDADLLIAVTISDEVNMMACQVAYSLFSVPTKVARIRNQAYLKSRWADLFTRGNMPVDVVISPELEVARALSRRLEVPGAFNVIPFIDGKARVLGIELLDNCPVIDTPLRQLTELFPNLHTTVIGIIRSGKVFIPHGSDQLQVGDCIYLAVEASMTRRVLSVFGREESTSQRVVIVGGGNIGLYLAEMLEESKQSTSIKIIEYNKDRASEIAEDLKKTVVIHGDGLDNDILAEANVQEADTIVAVADDDEVNILTSLLAKKEGCPRAITLLTNSIYGPLVGTLGIDVALDPRETTVSSIVRHIRRGRIKDLHSIKEGEAEIIELEVIDGSEISGTTVSELRLKSEVRIGVISRGKDMIEPASTTRFESGDRVVLLTVRGAVKKIEHLFSARADLL